MSLKRYFPMHPGAQRKLTVTQVYEKLSAYWQREASTISDDQFPKSVSNILGVVKSEVVECFGHPSYDDDHGIVDHAAWFCDPDTSFIHREVTYGDGSMVRYTEIFSIPPRIDES